MSVVLDSNLWISAFIFRGRPLELVEMGLDRLVDIAVSPSIIDETLRVMNDKFHAKPIVLESALFIMTTSARMVEPVIQVKAVRDDPNDDQGVPRASEGDKGSFRTWSFNHTAYQDGLEKTLTLFRVICKWLDEFFRHRS